VRSLDMEPRLGAFNLLRDGGAMTSCSLRRLQELARQQNRTPLPDNASDEGVASSLSECQLSRRYDKLLASTTAGAREAANRTPLPRNEGVETREQLVRVPSNTGEPGNNRCCRVISGGAESHLSGLRRASVANEGNRDGGARSVEAGSRNQSIGSSGVKIVDLGHYVPCA
jgi:hypothetical protein